MSQTTVVRLIKSLSSSEKRQFKLNSRKQSGNKEYLYLFDTIDQSTSSDPEKISALFMKKCPGASLNNTARYLVKLITDGLLQSKMDKDIQFQLQQQLMKVKILQERSVTEKSYKELRKIREAATNSQQHHIRYFTYREELNYFSARNFQGISDKELIQLQMKAKDALKTTNHIHDHYSLFELLKYRLVHSGKVISDNDKKQLNDLMLSEMTLMAGKVTNSFASQKLHLLFQSFFFNDIGDYRSALKTFHELNRLFEKNLHLLDNPPSDYLTVLHGILDSLQTLNDQDEMAFYLEKLRALDVITYPEYFRYMVRKAIATFQLAIYTGKSEYQQAVTYIETLPVSVLRSYNMMDGEKQWELYFYCSLSYFGNRNYKKAHRYIQEIMSTNPLHPPYSVCKAARLLNIILYFQQGDIQYLEYEIRAYKRAFQQKNKMLKCEKLLFKLIQLSGSKKRPDKKTIAEMEDISKDKYERQVLKYFDFIAWAFKRFGL